MKDNFQTVKGFLIELNHHIIAEDEESQIFIINDEDEAIHNMVIDCEDEILIIEQYIMDLHAGQGDIHKQLLQKNREILHGAFVLDDTGTKLFFHDTLQIENLDSNELEGSINSLKMLLAEYSGKLLDFAGMSEV